MPASSSHFSLKTTNLPSSEAALARQLQEAAAILKQGGLVAFPTETVYGLGADAENPAALRRLYMVKGRPEQHPVIVHVASAAQLTDWAVDIPSAAFALAKAFWPGPLTLILPRASRVPDAVTGGQDTVGLRVPSHPVALALLQAFGGGIAAPSANRFGRISPTTAAHVQADLGADVALIVDGGACAVGVESTIVAFRGETPVILRPGMITAGQIAQALGMSAASLVQAQAGEPLSRAPGTLASHYAPKTPLDVVLPEHLAPDHLQRLLMESPAGIGILARRAKPAALQAEARLSWLQADDSADGFAQGLYAALRTLDGMGLQRILVEAPPETESWAAVRDRLRRAACR